MIADDEEIEVPGVGGHAPRKVARRVVSDIIEPRVEEIFSEARRRIEEAGLIEQISAGFVLTGGAVLMEGMVECAEEVLGMPVRLGFPIGVKGIVQLVQGPQYATGVGLVRFGAGKLAEARARAEAAERAEPEMRGVAVEQIARRGGLWTWFKAAF
jgi:cell division protein FtsA